jgi:DNA processing protein
MKINSISPLKHKYLQIVTSIAKSPNKLHYIGTLPETRLPSIAIVGTRKPSRYGVEVTERLAYDLAARGVIVISGLALGIDAIAHRAALEARGTTIAVLANPLPAIQPRSNHDLGEQIIKQGGALISEQEGDYQVGKWSFLARNRIVAGLSDAVLITEAAARSGSLNTAMYALEQGKEVFVVPGNITSPLSAGCNALLKQGATPVTCVEDILEVIAPSLLNPQKQLALGSTEQESAILAQLQAGIRDADEVQRITGLSAGEMNTALTMLEIAGSIKALGANQWTAR